MPRTVASKVHVALPPREAWRLRCSFALEERIATLGKRTLTLLEEETACAGAHDEQRRRVVRCELAGDLIGGAVMGVKAKDLGSEIESTHFVHLYDETHGAEFSVRMALRRVNLTIAGRQWCLPESEASCFLCTRVYLDARIVGIGGLVEMQLERQMRASHAAFPGHACAFLAAQAHDAAPAPRPPAPVEVEDVAVALVASEPSLGRWWLLGDAIARSFARRRSRRLLSPGDATATVRVGRRHARLLLACGCASAAVVVEPDEIVE
jgi:hypothetical protein